jgi:putative ABC transport system permease protein
VRIADVFRLALGALWQQKARTVLTTLGVIFGSFVLVVSLSIGQGVQETILREASKYGDLRKIIVHPIWKSKTDTPPKPVEVRGKMSEERRRRLEQALTNRGQGHSYREPETPLTPDRVHALEGLPHVTAAVPGGYRRARARRDGFLEVGSVQAVLPGNAALRERLLAGELFDDPAAADVVVTDLLLYQLGIADDADLERVIGTTLQLDFLDPNIEDDLAVTGQAAIEARLSDEERRRIADVLQRLPEALAMLKLKNEEQAALRKLLDRKKRPRAGPEFTRELTIRAVVRSSEGGSLGLKYFENLDGDLFVPPKMLDSILGPLGGRVGFDWVVLEVDDMDAVKPMTVLLKVMGYSPDSLVERIEHERFTYLLVFGGMTIVAGVALLVAALGITNTMLISVLERIREIGVMKAIGAKDRHILSIFLVEGAVIGLLGGLLGLWLAWGVSGPCDSWLRGMLASGTTIKLEHSIFVFPLWLLLAVPAFACLVTTLAAVYPARRAARVDPVTALRHE